MTARRYEAEYRLRHADDHWGCSTAARWRSPDGTALRMSGAFTDITARKHTEERLQATLAENEALVREWREALPRVHTLSGLVPICMHGKKVRDDAGYWARIEEYLSSHTGAAVTHRTCPRCLQLHYPDFSQ